MAPLIQGAELNPIDIPPTFSVETAWPSLDGTKVVYLALDGDGQRVFLKDLQSGTVRDISLHPPALLNSASFAWSPDGMRILCSWRKEYSDQPAHNVYEVAESSFRSAPDENDWLIQCFFSPQEILLIPRPESGRDQDIQFSIHAFDIQTSETRLVFSGPAEVVPFQITLVSPDRFLVGYWSRFADGAVDMSSTHAGILEKRVAGELVFSALEGRKIFDLYPGRISPDGRHFYQLAKDENSGIRLKVLNLSTAASSFEETIPSALLDQGAVVGWLGDDRLLILKSPAPVTEEMQVIRRPGAGPQLHSLAFDTPQYE